MNEPTTAAQEAPLSRPGKQGLYDPQFEKDACGFGFVVDIKGRKSNSVLRNAIEVSPPASHVAFHICKEDRFVCFRISDQGPGVDPALGDGIFNAFVSKKQGGTGLGLSIVHRIVSGHGGTIRFFNADTGGAVFEVRLPA